MEKRPKWCQEHQSERCEACPFAEAGYKDYWSAGVIFSWYDQDCMEEQDAKVKRY